MFKNSKIFLVAAALGSFVTGFFMYLFACNCEWYKAVYNSLALFAFSFKECKVPDYNLLYIPALISGLVTFATIIMLFSKLLNTHRKHLLMRLFGGHTIVVGLGSNNRYYLDSEIASGNSKIIVIESDPTNKHINRYKDSSIVIITNYIDEVIRKIGLRRVKNIVISTGDDRENINIALKIIKRDKECKKSKSRHPKMVVHIEDLMLRQLYINETMLVSNRFDISVFSFYHDSAVELFGKHYIDGDGFDIINSDKEFTIVVIGDSILAQEVIAQACRVAHLPNENRLIIESFSKNGVSFKQKLEGAYTQIEKIPNIQINYHNADLESREFYQNPIFTKSDLKHIVICEESQDVNISTALKFIDRTFREKIVADELKCKIHFALYTNSVLANEISKRIEPNKINAKKNSEINYIRRLNSFANAREICHKDNLIGDKKYKIGKIIHYGYGSVYKPNLQFISKGELNKKWWGEKTVITDRESSIAQAEHMNIKLKALGLKMVNAKDKFYADMYDILLKKNKKMLFSKLSNDFEELNISEDFLIEASEEIEKYYSGKPFKVKYFPKEYKTVFEKLIRAEHNRWNANHYIWGFEYNKDKTDKTKKEHECLIPLDKFDKDTTKITVFYDIYSVLYIPSYLAQVGCELKEL